MRKWIAVGILGLVIGCARVGAQQKPPSLEAHELYFSAITSDVKDEETSALASYLNTAGVAGSEHKAAVQALLKFRHRYDALIDAYNHSPSTLAGNNNDTALFLAQRDMLVQNTIELLQASLSKESFHPEKMIPNYIAPAKTDATMHRHGTRFLPTQNGMSPHYSTSRSSSVSVDANGNETYYETVVVSGYTTCSYCPFIHQGHAGNTLNGGGIVYGPQVSPPSYISVTNQQSFFEPSTCFNAIFPESCNTTWEEEGQVHCSGTGNNIYNWSNPFEWFQFTMHPAIVFSKVNSGGPGQGWYHVSEWCQPQYVPPDLTMVLINQTQNFTPTFFETAGMVVNSTLTSGVWLSTPGLSQGLTGGWDLQYCTHTTPPY